MNKKLLSYAAIPALALTLVGVGTASAHGWFGFGLGSQATPQQVAQTQTDQFQQEATLLGISVDAVKGAWAKGETLQQLAQDNGITEAQLQQKMQDQAKTERQQQIQDLVDQGVITQDQANERLQFESTQAQNMQQRGFHGRGPGMGAAPATGSSNSSTSTAQ